LRTTYPRFRSEISYTLLVVRTSRNRRRK
jgi:hypothetical protein